MATRTQPLCSKRDPQEYPMYPECLNRATQYAIAADSKAAMVPLTISAEETVKANAALSAAQIKLAQALKKILDKNRVKW